MKKILVMDLSPVFYRWGFASTTFFARSNKRMENGLYDFSKYKDIFIFQVLEYISKQKSRFGVNEIVLGVDSKPYWRETHWPGYKYGRFKNDKSGVDWGAVKKVQKDIIKLLDEACSFKVIDVEGAEADDVGFVLSEHLSKDNEIILHTVDHDWTQNMIHENVKVWETKYMTPTKTCGFVEINRDEIQELKDDHVIYGDKGDNVQAINAFTQFSPEFKEEYKAKIDEGVITPLKVYPKRHQLDVAFAEKFKDKYPDKYEKGGLSMYKHPPFGKKSFEKKKLKNGTTLEDFLKENPIHQKNYDLNSLLVLAESIPLDIKERIIEKYNNCNTERDVSKFNDFVMDFNAYDLMGRSGLY